MPTGQLPGLAHVTLENNWIRRSWCIVDGLATTEYAIRPREGGPWLEAMHWHPWWPLDGLVAVDGVDLPISRTVDPPEEGMIRGVFAVRDVRRWTGDGSHGVDFVLAPGEGLPRVEVTLHAELIGDQPLMRTWLTAVNVSDGPLRITRTALEAVYPNRLEMEVMWSGFDTECLVDNDQRFPARAIPRTVRYEQPLGPGQSCESFRLMTAVCPSDRQWRTAARHDLVHAFAPHTCRPKILQQADGWADLDELRASIDEAAAVGVEVVLLFVAEGWSYGDLELSPKLFPRGEQDVRELCRYAEQRGVEIGFYVGECIATPDSRIVQEHPDWQFLGIEGRRYSPGSIGNMCLSSPWGEHFRRKIDWLLGLGVRALQTDGPPYSQVCFEASHGHGSPETACLENWAWEQRFNRDRAERGVFVQSPTVASRLFDGVGQIPGGYTEDDMSVLKGLDQITQFRANLVAANDQLPPSCRWGFMSVGTMYGGGRPSMVGDPEHELDRLEHALATHLGLGFTGCLHGKHLYSGPKSRAVVERWIGFYRTYRRLLTARTVTLGTPDCRGIDGVMHCHPHDNPCAVAVLFNPSDRPQCARFLLPLELAGWREGRKATVRAEDCGEAGPLEIDDRGCGLLEVHLGPRQVSWREVNWT